MQYTYKQISEITGKKAEDLRKLAHKLNLKRKLKKGVAYLDKEGFETIVAYLEPKTIPQNPRTKIRVMERYFKSENYRDVARTCSISRKTVKAIVEEWEETDCILVDSSINFREKIQNKGIFNKGTKWGYSIMKKGVKYYKSGFEIESEAIDALYKLKEELNE